MTPKIQKLAAEIGKTRTRLSELQERLQELERQKTELENTEIVALFRSVDIPADQLPAFIASMKAKPVPAPAEPPFRSVSGFAREDGAHGE